MNPLNVKSSLIVSASRIAELLQLEPLILLLGLGLSTWIFYKLLLRNLNPDRHAALQRLFKNLVINTITLCFLFAAYHAIGHYAVEGTALEHLTPYVGLVGLLWGAIFFIQVSRIAVFEYLYLSHMRVAVPIFLVNIFSLILSIMIIGWFATEIFGFRLTPLLATSAIFSLVIGLAVQETLGNLFAGISLQFDKPYEIGDWVEVQNGLQKWIGQVQEITWRATTLIGLSDEAVTIPNRVIAQAQIANFNSTKKPFARAQMFRITYDSDVNVARNALLRALGSAKEIETFPKPIVFVSESAESWILLKAVYFLHDYGAQWRIGDHVIELCLNELAKANIKIAVPRLSVDKTE